MIRATASVCLILAICLPCFARDVSETAFERGMHLASSGDFEGARQEFEAALRMQPRSPVVLNALGATYTHTGEPQDARQLFQRALEIAPQFAPARKNLALSYFNSGKYDLAIPHLRELTTNDQSKQFALLLLGMISEARKEYQRAVGFFRDSERIVFQHPPATLSFAHSLFEVGEAREAGLALDGLCQIPAAAADDYRQAGLLALKYGQYERAVSQFARAKEADPAPSSADYHLALALYRLGRHEEAMQILRGPASEKPDGLTLNLLGHVAKKLGDLELAVESLKKAAELEPDREGHYLDLTTLCVEHENPQLGLEIVEIGVRNIPESHRLLVQKGMLLERLGRLQEAEQALRAAINRGPDESSAMASLAMVQLQGRRFDSAVETLVHSIKAFPDDFYVHYGYGVVLRMLLETEGEQTERFDNARKAFETAIRLNPNFVEARYELARLLEYKDAAAAAAQEFARVLRIDPGHTSAKYRLGRLYVAMGRHVEARKLLDEVQADKIAKLNAEKQERLVIVSR